MSFEKSNESMIAESDLKSIVVQVLNTTWEQLSVPLSTWQISQLNRQDSVIGINCLLKMWLIVQPNLEPGSFCNATWDGHYCWPPTSNGTKASRTCSEAFRESQPKYAPHLQGEAFRICRSDGTWLKGDWTNYSECANSYEDHVKTTAEERELVTQVQYILFFGSILSLVFLLTAISIFCWFKSLWCDRVTIHIHLMVALTIRYVLLYIITEPFVFQRDTNYRYYDWVCKMVIILYLYSTLTSVNWMLIQGVYLNGKLTTNVFDKAAPFKLYYTIGWVLPVPLLAVYAIVMQSNHPLKCWKGYSEMDEIWIVQAPIIVELMVNLLLLVNILRILLTKVHRNSSSSDAVQFQRAAKATLILSPILGINNLLFIYNPGGEYHKIYVLLNTLFSSTQGIFVTLVYCYLSPDVCNAIRRCYHRFLARRNANRAMQQRRANSMSTASASIVEQPVSCCRRNRSNFRHNSNLLCLNLQPSPTSTCSTSVPEGSSRSPRKSNSSNGFCPNARHTVLFVSLKIERGSISSSVLQQNTNPFLSVTQNEIDACSSSRLERRGTQQQQHNIDETCIPLRELV